MTALPHPPPGSEKGCVTVTADWLIASKAWPSTDRVRVERVLAAATEAVLDYAPRAPTALLDEAAVRFGGYLLGSDYGGIVEQELGPKRLTYVVNHAAAFRNSGAAMLLTRHKRRRARPVG